VPSLTTTQRQVGPVTIVDLRGNIGLGATRLTFRRTIHDLIESGRTKILLNLSQVDSVDSAGVGELVGAYVPVKTKGGELKILNPTKNVHRMMQITQLDRVFEVYTDEQMALQSFS